MAGGGRWGAEGKALRGLLTTRRDTGPVAVGCSHCRATNADACSTGPGRRFPVRRATRHGMLLLLLREMVASVARRSMV